MLQTRPGSLDEPARVQSHVQFGPQFGQSCIRLSPYVVLGMRRSYESGRGDIGIEELSNGVLKETRVESIGMNKIGWGGEAHHASR